MPIGFAIPPGSQQGVNVRVAYGAAGDGTTDDSAAFLAAINALNGTGVKLYVPPGRYPVSLSLTDQDVQIYGEGTLIHRQAASVMNVLRTAGPAISVTGFATVLLGVRSGVVSTDSATYTQTLSVASVAGIAQGQLYILSSQDAYAWSVAAGGTGATIWQTQYVPILGLGLTYSGGTSGQFQEGQTVIGATSGATALLKSISDGGATGVLVFNSIAGTFSVGENLQIGGTTFGQVSAAACILTSAVLHDTYSTSPQIQLINTAPKFSIEGVSIDASGDTEQIVGAANRLPAFVLQGVYQPVVKGVSVLNAWTRCWQFLSCWKPDVDVKIVKLPNNANPSEAAYGYGVEFAGSTEGGRCRVMGGNCRHAFTTNVFWGGFAYMNIWNRGTVRGNLVYDSVITGNFNAAFDSHAGAVNTTFANCITQDNSHANRNVSANVGFQNRGVGTSYLVCRSIGAVIGFNDLSPQYDPGYAHTVRYFGCQALEYQSLGFSVGVAEGGSNGWYDFDNCHARGNGDAPGGGHYAQTGFYVNGYNNVRMRNCTSERFNSSPFWFGGGGYLRLIGLVADYRINPGFSLGMRFDGVPIECSIADYRVIYDPNHGAPFGIFYNSQSSVVTLDLAGDVGALFDSSRCPIIDTRSSGAGPFSLIWHGMSAGMNVSADHGDASATLVPRAGPRVHRWATPLTANRTVSLTTLSATTGLSDGDWMEVMRDAAATGAYTLTVATTPAVTLAAGQSVRVVYDGADAKWVPLPGLGTGGGASLTVTDGTNSVSSTASLTVSGATVGGSGGAATLTIPAAPVSSVAGRTGAVVLAVADVSGAAGSANVLLFTSGGSYTKSAGAKLVRVIGAGGGGGGGGGGLGASGAAVSGGGGGGGGGYFDRSYRAADIPASAITIGVGAAGTGGAASAASSTAGTAGGNGGNTTFGTIMTAFGGGGGAGGQPAGVASAGGGGAGLNGAGGAASGATAGAGGSAFGLAGGAAAGGGASSTYGVAGSGAGGTTVGGANNGGASLDAGPGGGAGGGVSASAGANSGGGGGRACAVCNGTAFSSGGSSGTPAGGSTAASVANIAGYGGGGGYGSATAGGAGGAGTNGAGGGGGGSAQNGGAAGAGGAGGGGFLLIIEHF